MSSRREVIVERTWDGEPVSATPPYGATVIVWRRSPSLEFLILHRVAPGVEEGDWAWTPPSGARKPGESVLKGAGRELEEEAGLSLPLRAAPFPTDTWAVFSAKAPPETAPTLHDREHDRWKWMTLEEALTRCRPDVVARAIERMAEHLQSAEHK